MFHNIFENCNSVFNKVISNLMCVWVCVQLFVFFNIRPSSDLLFCTLIKTTLTKTLPRDLGYTPKGLYHGINKVAQIITLKLLTQKCLTFCSMLPHWAYSTSHHAAETPMIHQNTSANQMELKEQQYISRYHARNIKLFPGHISPLYLGSTVDQMVERLVQ